MSCENGDLLNVDASASALASAATSTVNVAAVTAAGLTRHIPAGIPQASPFDEINYQNPDLIATKDRPEAITTLQDFVYALMARILREHIKEAESDGSVARFSLTYVTPLVVDTENNLTLQPTTHETADTQTCLIKKNYFFPIEVSTEVVTCIYEILKLYFGVDKWPKFGRIAEFVDKIVANPFFARSAELSAPVFPELKNKLVLVVVRSFAMINGELFTPATGSPEFEKKIQNVMLFINACAKICFELALFTKPEYAAALNKETVAKVNIRVPKINLLAFIGYIVGLDGALRDTMLDIVKKLENLEIVIESAKKAKPPAARKVGAGKKTATA